MGIDDSTSVAITALLAEEGDDIGFIEYANGFQRQQFRIAGARADAGQAAFGIRLQSPALANALTAAAVIADPPMRPRTTAQGIASGLSIRASFDSVAPTKPTGMPMKIGRAHV